ncbi:MAG: winged helix-turn-helix transcriptional regulator [Kiritimatiellae bacterium]|nr:winged helix-turn-helix transcriptional regulator [Kiritimatiellia bacterium]
MDNQTDQKTAQKTTPKTTQKTTKEKLLDIVQENSKLTREEIATILDISPDTVKFHLANLKNEGRLQRVGGRKEGHWEVVS